MSLNLDKSAWKRVTLGDVTRHVTDRVDAETSGLERFLAGEHIPRGSLSITEWGIIGRDPIGPMFYKRFQPGHVLYVSRRTYLRKVAVPEFEGITGEKTFVLETLDEGVLLQVFLPFVLSAERFHAYAIANSRGSVNPYLNWGELAAYEFDLPPLEEQKHIADLLWAVERHRLALAGQEDAMRETLRQVTARRLADLPEKARLGDFATTRSGPSFAASDVHGEPVNGSIPVIGIPNTKPDGTVDLSKVGYVTGLPDSVGRVDDSSLILIRTNGNRQRIGNVYLPPSEAHGHAVSAFQFLMQVHDAADRDYIFWVLSESSMQDRMSEGASGTVGLGNLAVRWLNAQEIPWSHVEANRTAVVRELQVINYVVDQVVSEMDALKGTRAALLSDIFGGI
ncbi:hypothetical protein G3M53_18570 [Streptomyces sp. SID7982]|nr:hypothetical protein [Streptomyces sp. SID7982]